MDWDYWLDYFNVSLSVGKSIKAYGIVQVFDLYFKSLLVQAKIP